MIKLLSNILALKQNHFIEDERVLTATALLMWSIKGPAKKVLSALGDIRGLNTSP